MVHSAGLRNVCLSLFKHRWGSNEPHGGSSIHGHDEIHQSRLVMYMMEYWGGHFALEIMLRQV